MLSRHWGNCWGLSKGWGELGGRGNLLGLIAQVAASAVPLSVAAALSRDLYVDVLRRKPQSREFWLVARRSATGRRSYLHGISVFTSYYGNAGAKFPKKIRLLPEKFD